jgi:hypothetical protein
MTAGAPQVGLQFDDLRFHDQIAFLKAGLRQEELLNGPLKRR